MELLVYTNRITPRIEYTFDLMIGDIAGFLYSITTDYSYFINYEGPKMSYGTSFDGVISVPNAGFLEGVDKDNIDLDFVLYDSVQCPFKVDGQTDFPFDVFSAAFYLVSRCEEYSNQSRDRHDRFSVYESLAYKKSFLEKPVVNHWALELRRKVLSKYPPLEFKAKKHQVIATFDIDQLFAVKARGVKRTIGRLLKHFLSLDMQSVLQSLYVLLGIKNDPFYTFDYIFSLKKKWKNEFVFFIHLGDYDAYDKSIRWNHPDMIKTIQHIATYSEVGLHPSYRSNESSSVLKMEFDRFEKILENAPSKTRQHYLKLSLPYTYENLIDRGVSEDYSMGYSECVGYRASISTPFYFYNLNKEEKTSLKVYPFSVMDRALKDGMRLSVSQSISKIEEMIQAVELSEGLFVFLFHNESLSENREWKGWRKVFEAALKA